MYNVHKERIEAIDIYYTNLEYENRKQEDLEKITVLSKELRYKNYELSKRLIATASIVEKYSFLFNSFCKHVDVVKTICECLTHCGMSIWLNNKYNNEEQQINVSISILLTIIDILPEYEVYCFFHRAIIKDSIRNKYNNILNYLSKLRGDPNPKKSIKIHNMILLEDSDLYAVIGCLKILQQPLSNIWVQEPIKQNFLSLLGYLHNSHLDNFHQCIRSFRSREELLIKHISYHISKVSIWSEDITAAKNLASFLNADIVFINTHMDFYPSVFIPYVDFVQSLIDQMSLDNIKQSSDFCDIRSDIETVCLLSTPEIESASINNLFYDGMWQKPMKGIYWKNNDKLWANATRDDIVRCVNSAKKGFEIWSTKSVDFRLQILSKLAFILKNNGYLNESLLAIIVSRWTKFPCLCEDSWGLCSQNDEVEVIRTRRPKGVIILKEKDGSALFFRLMQILIAGNSVIVILNENFYNLAKYCDIFSTCGIPPGVINLLSNENIASLELTLCNNMYTDYAKWFWYYSEDTIDEKYITPYINLTTPKLIIFPLK